MGLIQRTIRVRHPRTSEMITRSILINNTPTSAECRASFNRLANRYAT